MKKFMDHDFLLTTPTAKELYQTVERLPIVDYHCHVSPREIYEDLHYDNIVQLWLSGDHYKWRLMRFNGVEERFITGDASDREKFQKFAESLPRAIGNPIYQWCHLELRRYFGYDGVLNGETAQAVWDLTSEVLKSGKISVRKLICDSNVAFIGTTDDPIDSLEWHEKIMADTTFKTRVAPTFRPDKALNIEKSGWMEYIARLSHVSGVGIHSFEDLKHALCLRMDRFTECGCRASDHGLDYVVYAPYTDATIEPIFQKARSGAVITDAEVAQYKTALLVFCSEEYVRRNWVMQIHYNCMRNPNSSMFRRLGPDTGFDCVGPNNGSLALASLLDHLFSEGILPRTILYSLDGGDNLLLDTLIGSFQGSEIRGKLQHGSAWWFNDHKEGIIDHLTNLASVGVLGNFVGMLTDSRSFLSYTRHEYFRRILCDMVGNWVENGEYPADLPCLTSLLQDICCGNALQYFNLKELEL